MAASKLPTPADIGGTYASEVRRIAAREGAHVMAKLIRDALRKSARDHAARDGGGFLRASWALHGFADLIDDALRDSPPKE